MAYQRIAFEAGQFGSAPFGQWVVFMGSHAWLGRVLHDTGLGPDDLLAEFNAGAMLKDAPITAEASIGLDGDPILLVETDRD
jgi:hypothetical protein